MKFWTGVSLIRFFIGVAAASTFGTLDAASLLAADVFSWNLGEARLVLTDDGASRLVRNDGASTGAPVPAFALVAENGESIAAVRVEKERTDAAPDSFRVCFADGSRADFEVRLGNNFALFDLKNFDAKTPIKRFDFFQIGAPQETKNADLINTAIFPDGFRLGVAPGTINVKPSNSTNGGMKVDRDGCSHSFRQIARTAADRVDGIDPNKPIAEFCATSTRETADGYSVRGKDFASSINLTGCRAIRARVFGDGKDEALKIQLGGANGHRDDYINVDFNGWKTFDLTDSPLNDLSYDDVRRIAFYYNGLPANESVRCLIDRVEAVFGEGADEKTVLLEDFAAPTLAYWDSPARIYKASTFARHKLAPARCVVVAASDECWSTAIQEMEIAAGLASPKPGGSWRDRSKRVRESYFFLTSFNVAEYDAALKFAKRGGFRQILLLQNSWCESTGHFRVNEQCFPGGLATLRETIDKFRSEGIRFGLHFLAASIDSNDPYLTPIPDKRFVLGVATSLAADLDADSATTRIETATDATVFPIGEDPYMGAGQIVRVDDELIYYDRTDKNGLVDCQRGFYGTKIAPHKKGSAVSHFVRAYGYHMYDLDTDFPEEIAANFAQVANALPLDMIYFDGSELLQRPGDGGDHWYYNARLHRAFYDAVNDKNILYQASSCSPYSWNQLSRTASADGHDDLKAYLEERSGSFLSLADNYLPLDIGWYYGYDRRATPDMYEYVLGATIGYDSSLSFQASVAAASIHPFIGEILDMIRVYEELRLSGKIPEELRKNFRIDPVLAGVKTEEERNALLGKRNDFHLETSADGTQAFRRVVYPIWQNVSADVATSTWELTVDRSCRIGLQVQFKEEGETPEGANVVNPKIEIDGKSLNGGEFAETLAAPSELARGQYVFSLPGQNRTKYGRPLVEPEVSGVATPDVRLEPGVYRITFSVDSGAELPIRVRTPLYTDEIYTVPK